MERRDIRAVLGKGIIALISLTSSYTGVQVSVVTAVTRTRECPLEVLKGAQGGW